MKPLHPDSRKAGKDLHEGKIGRGEPDPQIEGCLPEDMIHEDECLEDLQNGYFILQKVKGFRFGIDAVLLADFASARTEKAVLDLGTGSGILPILLSARGAAEKITAMEIQKPYADMAKRSMLLTHLEEKIHVMEGDLKEATKLFGERSMDMVISNPPYLPKGHGATAADEGEAIARHEICASFADIAGQASGVLKEGGRFCFIHRPFRLAEIFRTLKENHLEPKRMRLVFPYLHKEPNLVLLEAMKGAREGLRIEKPLIVYDRPGVYTGEILAIYNRKAEKA